MFIIIYFRLGFSIVNHRLIWGKPMIVGKLLFWMSEGSSGPPSGAVLVGSIWKKLFFWGKPLKQCYEVKTQPWQEILIKRMIMSKHEGLFQRMTRVI